MHTRGSDSQGLDAQQDGTASAPASDFDQLPYLSMPVPYSQPSRLAALALLHGLAAPDVEQARVLELGCASGGNLVPMAARFPSARFVGIDLSSRHVEDAGRRIARLGLRNISVRQADIAEAGLDGETFDYILCHGVFSWVPRHVQDAILSICRDRLSAEGIAIVSYNVLPGWHLRNVVRSLCFQHAGTTGTPLERVARARAILDEIARSPDAAGLYGDVIRAEAKRLAGRPDSYIYGEFLPPDNAPCTFREFAGRAMAHGLAFLCEGDLPSSVPERIAARAAPRIKALAAGDPIAEQEYTDFFTGRTFRRTVLVRHGRKGGHISRSDARLLGLHISARLKTDLAPGESASSLFTDSRGRAVEVRHPGVRRAFTRLAAEFPSTIPVGDLSSDGRRQSGLQLSAEERQVRDALLELAASGWATLTTTPLRSGHGNCERPRLSLLAMAEVTSNQPWVTTTQHTGVAVTPLHRAILALFDGRRDRAMMQAMLLATHRAGKIDLAGGETGLDEPVIGARAAHHVKQAVDFAAVNGLLDPE